MIDVESLPSYDPGAGDPVPDWDPAGLGWDGAFASTLRWQSNYYAETYPDRFPVPAKRHKRYKRHKRRRRS